MEEFNQAHSQPPNSLLESFLSKRKTDRSLLRGYLRMLKDQYLDISDDINAVKEGNGATGDLEQCVRDQESIRFQIRVLEKYLDTGLVRIARNVKANK